MQRLRSQFAVTTAHARGFTLVELLVVVAIIGVLLALLMPSIQSAREASRRTACQSQLKQIGMALHGYHNLHGKLPRGGWLPPAIGLSWTAATLPFLEEQSLFDRLDRRSIYTSISNQNAGKTVLPLLICPSSPRDSLYRSSPDLPSSSTVTYARTDYGAVNGERSLRSSSATNTPERGAMIYERNISFSGILDGTSKTILIGEAPEGMHGIWLSTRNLFDQSGLINAPATFSKQYVFLDFGQELSSYHTGGALTLFADGSVHFLPTRLEKSILAALCSRAGGETMEDW